MRNRCNPQATVLIVSLFFSLTFTSTESLAAINLSVNPLEGGNTLRFGRVNRSLTVNKEVKIRVSSDSSTQYQVFQRIADPLTNERGETLHPQALVSYALSGSNSYGTLYQQDVSTMGYGDQLIYTSSSNGESDLFTVVYNILGDKVDNSGNFNGRIIYTLRPIGAGSQQEVVVNTYAEISGELEITADGSSGKFLVRLDAKNPKDHNGYFTISFSDNMGKDLKIFQETAQYPHDEVGEEISPEAIEVTIEGAEGIMAYQTPSALNHGRELIYQSNAPERKIVVNFHLNDEMISQQKAGNYQGRIQYSIESERVESLLDLDLEIKVEPVFNLETIFPPEGMRFANVLPNSPPQYREVKVRVESNLKRPYMVSQRASALLTNETGDVIPEEMFSLKQELSNNASGKIFYDDFQPLKQNDDPIYYSNNRGDPVEFKVIYRLNSSPMINAGNYSTNIIYSLGEI